MESLPVHTACACVSVAGTPLLAHFKNEHAPYKRGVARSRNGGRTFLKSTIKMAPS